MTHSSLYNGEDAFGTPRIIIIKSEASTLTIVFIVSLFVFLRCLWHNSQSVAIYRFWKLLIFVSITTVQSTICAKNWVHHGLKIVSFACTLRYLIVIITQTFHQYSLKCLVGWPIKNKHLFNGHSVVNTKWIHFKFGSINIRFMWI